ncbi:response regulator receiver domain protein [delta proteobacterium NaphS2]|nr:response regulator receiver domain protein [delta proteobacterium NaphS2]
MEPVILLLDDNLQIRRDLGMRLDKKGYAVHTASTIEEAKKLIMSERIDFAIIDLKLDYKSEYGGLDIITHLKRHQPNVKAIVLSGYLMQDLQLDADKSIEIDEFVSKRGEENYILAIIKALARMEKAPKEKLCFVIMPFSTTKSCTQDEWTEVFEKLIQPAIENSGFGFRCIRSNPIQGSIIEDILDQLNRADLVLADLTDRNPNVFYELGVRHTLRDSTILIAQRTDDIPFDLRHFAVQTYEWKLSKNRKAFADRIKDVIEQIQRDTKKGASPIRKYLQL